MTAPDLIDIDAQQIDDCWNRIGIHGDRSCPLLAYHIHCRNCAVYSAAATRLLDRYSLAVQDRAVVQSSVLPGEINTRSVVVFRLGEEWLGLPTRCLVEVANVQTIHSLPHQRSRALLGVANVRGALVACGGPVVSPVDEVDGIHAMEEHLLEAASAPGQHATAKFTQGVMHWKNRSLRLLDEQQLLSAVNRSLT